MGGLTASLVLAKEGFKVCVLQQHYRPGGCLHRFFTEDVPFETGFHNFGGVGLLSNNFASGGMSASLLLGEPT